MDFNEVYNRYKLVVQGTLMTLKKINKFRETKIEFNQSKSANVKEHFNRELIKAKDKAQKAINSLVNINEKAKTELMHLKSQVNPHFFFNMLNNLYGWVDKDPVKAKKLILSLSDMMRYSIYEGEKDSVSLEEEVVYMQQYIELHRMRYHKEIDIQFVIDTPENPVHVMPLLFIILLENAFKHGVENLRENAFVHLKMVANDKQVVFEIANNFDPKEIPTTPGIGVQNLKRRLELVYPKKHSLILDSDNGIYKAKLTLEI